MKIVDKRGRTVTVYVNPAKKKYHTDVRSLKKEIRAMANAHGFKVENDSALHFSLRKELPPDAEGYKQIIEIDARGSAIYGRWRVEGQTYRIREGVIRDRRDFYEDRVNNKLEALAAVKDALVTQIKAHSALPA